MQIRTRLCTGLSHIFIVHTHRLVSGLEQYMYVWLSVKVSCKLDWHRQGQVVNRPCVSFFIGMRNDDDVCQWANCHSKTWQELLQKIADIISRQGKCRRFFVSPTPDYLLSLKFIIIHKSLILGYQCARNNIGTRPIDFLDEMDYIRSVHKEPLFYDSNRIRISFSSI